MYFSPSSRICPTDARRSRRFQRLRYEQVLRSSHRAFLEVDFCVLGSAVEANVGEVKASTFATHRHVLRRMPNAQMEPKLDSVVQKLTVPGR